MRLLPLNWVRLYGHSRPGKKIKNKERIENIRLESLSRLSYRDGSDSGCVVCYFEVMGICHLLHLLNNVFN